MWKILWLFVLKSVKSNCRFQGQTELCGSKPSDFRLAIEEAFLAEHGFSGARVDATTISSQPANYVSFPIQEATDSNHEQECQSRIKASKCNVICAYNHITVLLIYPVQLALMISHNAVVFCNCLR